MKKFLALLLSMALVFSLASCGDTKADSNVTDNSSTKEESAGPGVEVDEGLLNVDITIPAEFFENTTPEEIQKDAEESDFKKCVINPDNSVTYTMSKATHKKFMTEFKTQLDESIASMVNGEDAIESFQKIVYNDDISDVSIYVDSAKYTAFDAFSGMVFYFSGAYYQAFSGKDAEDIDVTVKFIDSDTEEVLDTMSYKEFVSNVENEASSSENG